MSNGRTRGSTKNQQTTTTTTKAPQTRVTSKAVLKTGPKEKQQEDTPADEDNEGELQGIADLRRASPRRGERSNADLSYMSNRTGPFRNAEEAISFFHSRKLLPAHYTHEDVTLVDISRLLGLIVEFLGPVAGYAVDIIDAIKDIIDARQQIGLAEQPQHSDPHTDIKDLKELLTQQAKNIEKQNSWHINQMNRLKKLTDKLTRHADNRPSTNTRQHDSSDEIPNEPQPYNDPPPHQPYKDALATRARKPQGPQAPAKPQTAYTGTHTGLQLAKHRELRRARQIMIAVDPNTEYETDGQTILLNKTETEVLDQLNKGLKFELDCRPAIRENNNDYLSELSQDDAFVATHRTSDQQLLVECSSHRLAETIQVNQQFRRSLETAITTMNKFSDDLIYIKLKTYVMVIKWVPIRFQGTEDDLIDITRENGLPPTCIHSCKWLKQPHRRHPNQRVANLQLVFNNPYAANTLLRNGTICIKGASLPIAKDLSEPLRCLKCQKWGHVAKYCDDEHDTCAKCGEHHDIKDCKEPTKVYCVGCETTDHPSNDRECPTFLERCKNHDIKHGGNFMQFFPTCENWSQQINLGNNRNTTRAPPPRKQNFRLEDAILRQRPRTPTNEPTASNTSQAPGAPTRRPAPAKITQARKTMQAQQASQATQSTLMQHKFTSSSRPQTPAQETADEGEDKDEEVELKDGRKPGAREEREEGEIEGAGVNGGGEDDDNEDNPFQATVRGKHNNK